MSTTSKQQESAGGSLCRDLYYKSTSNLSAKDRRRLDQALRVAENSDCRQRHGAVLMAGGRVLSVGINTNKNDPYYIGEDQLDKSIHAEIQALRAHGSKVKNGTIYIARLGKRDIPLMSKPCDNCQKALKEAGVKKVVYTIDNEMEI